MRPIPVLAAAVCLSGLAFAQGFGNLFEKAPPHVDEALRARINHFYKAHVDGKFRAADQVVHEDAKDTFFAAEKMKIRGFKIVSIAYEDNFSKAKVVTELDTDFFFVGFGTMKVHRPAASFWKLHEGQWWWYVPPYDPKEGTETAFGSMRTAEEVPGQPPAPLAQALSRNPHEVLKELQSKVRADKTEVALSSHLPSSAEVSITSEFPGPVTLRLEADQMNGLEVKLDKDKLEPGDAAKLRFACKPEGTARKPDLMARVYVEPTGQVIAIRMAFSPPPAGQ